MYKFRYITNLGEFEDISLSQKAVIGQVVSLSKRDVSGFTFPILFTINEISNDRISLSPLLPNYGVRTE